MIINRNNYELYLVDYLDGNLSKDMMQQVKQFLAINQDIREEFDCFNDNATVIPEVNFNEKKQLKKIPFFSSDANSEFFQQQCVAKIENLLNNEESAAFDEVIKNDKTKQKEYDQFAKTKLTPEHLIFNEKLTLKQANFSHVINPYNFEEYCVACSEGWLNQSGLTALNNYIKDNPHLVKEFNLYTKTKLTPDLSIKYFDKLSLKRTWLMPLKTSVNISVAASVAAIFLFGFMLFKNPSLNNQMNTAATNSLQKTETKETIIQSPDKIKTKNTKPVVLAHSKDEQKRNIATEQKSNSVIRHNELQLITPKTIDTIECRKCTDDISTIDTKNIEIVGPIGSNLIGDHSKTETRKISPRNVVKSALIASIKGAEVITNGKVRVKQDEEKSKTVVGFNSRFLAFSTNLNNNKQIN